MADGLRAGDRQGRRRDRNVRTGRHEHGDRHCDGDDGLVPHRLHYRTGGQQRHRVGCVPGDRHHRHHAADHEAQLPGDEGQRHRAGDSWKPSPSGGERPSGPGAGVDITKDGAARRRASSTGTRRQRRISRRSRGQGPTQSRRRSHCPHQRGRASADPRRARHHPGRSRGDAEGVRGAGADPGRRDAPRHRRLPGLPSPQPRHDGHARRVVGQYRHPGSRSPDCPRHAVRRPRHREREDVRA